MAVSGSRSQEHAGHKKDSHESMFGREIEQMSAYLEQCEQTKTNKPAGAPREYSLSRGTSHISSNTDNEDGCFDEPASQAPTHSIMIDFMNKSKWPELLDYVETRRNQESLIRLELTKIETKTQATPLHIAVRKAPLALTKLLLSVVPYKSRHDILLQTDADGNTPLHLACRHLELQQDDAVDISVIIVLGVGAPEAHSKKNKKGEIPLAALLQSPAMKAAYDRTKAESVTEALLRKILQDRTDDLALTTNNDGMTLLHIAAAHGVHEKVLLTLYAVASSFTTTADHTGQLPLHHLAATISSPFPPILFVTRMLESHPDILVSSSDAGETPLHRFVSCVYSNIPNSEERLSEGLEQLAEILLGDDGEEASCPLLFQSQAGLNPLHCCALFGAPSTVTRVLTQSQFFPKASLMIGLHGGTPLHLLCASSAIASLVKHVGLLGTTEAAVSFDSKGRTPLHVAAGNPNATQRVIDTLVLLNAAAVHTEDFKGLMPVHLAVRKKASIDVFKKLLDLNPNAVKATLECENTIYHEMCQFGLAPSMVWELIQLYPEGLKIGNELGNLPLHLATIYKCPIEVIKLIVDAYPGGCNSQNEFKDVPLHYAVCHENQVDTVEFLVAACITSIMTANERGDTPIDISRKLNVDAVIAQALTKATQNSDPKHDPEIERSNKRSSSRIHRGVENTTGSDHQRRNSFAEKEQLNSNTNERRRRNSHSSTGQRTRKKKSSFETEEDENDVRRGDTRDKRHYRRKSWSDVPSPVGSSRPPRNSPSLRRKPRVKSTELEMPPLTPYRRERRSSESKILRKNLRSSMASLDRTPKKPDRQKRSKSLTVVVKQSPSSSRRKTNKEINTVEAEDYEAERGKNSRLRRRAFRKVPQVSKQRDDLGLKEEINPSITITKVRRGSTGSKSKRRSSPRLSNQILVRLADDMLTSTANSTRGTMLGEMLQSPYFPFDDI